MRNFEIFRYIKKWMALILLVFIMMTFAFYNIFSSMQRYTASAVIRYSNVGAADGLTPNMEAIDTKEIYSSSVLTRVAQNLNLDSNRYSIDNLSSSITVIPIAKPEEEAIKAALNDKGEVYKTKPTDYIVSFTADSDESNEFARSVLNEVLDIYFSQYSERYVNVAAINNRTNEILQEDYDYIEIIESLDSSIDETLKALAVREASAPYFRSVSTGYSFGDTINEFNFLKKVENSKVFSDILKYQITKNREVLVTKYQKRIGDYALTVENSGKNAQAMLDIITTYVDKMRESGNADIDFNYILPDVYDNTVVDPLTQVRSSSDKTVEYDKLLESLIYRQEKEQHAIVNSAYASYVVEEFMSDKGIDPEYKVQVEQRVKERIATISAQMNSLYDVIERTNDEYNAYVGAQNITVLSSAAAFEKINIKLYTLIIGVFFLVLGCCGAVVLGRIGDIVEYMFYTDRKLNCSNRLACDRYIDANSSSVLSDHFGCIVLRLNGQQQLNEKYGRSTADGVLERFKSILQQQLQEVDPGGFLAYNGGGMFIAFTKQAQQLQMDDMVKKIHILVDVEPLFVEREIVYSTCGQVTATVNVHSIRELLTKTMENCITFRHATTEQTEAKGGAAVDS